MTVVLTAKQNYMKGGCGNGAGYIAFQFRFDYGARMLSSCCGDCSHMMLENLHCSFQGWASDTCIGICIFSHRTVIQALDEEILQTLK